MIQFSTTEGNDIAASISNTVDGTGSGLGTRITTADYSFDPRTCQHHLPCGYCKELRTFCLREPVTTITWSNSSKDNCVVGSIGINDVDHNSVNVIDKVENFTC